MAEIAFSSLSQYICTIARSSIGSAPLHLFTQLLNVNLTPLCQISEFSILLMLVNSGSVATVTGLSSVYPGSFLILPARFHGCVLIFTSHCPNRYPCNFSINFAYTRSTNQGSVDFASASAGENQATPLFSSSFMDTASSESASSKKVTFRCK